MKFSLNATLNTDERIFGTFATKSTNKIIINESEMNSEILRYTQNDSIYLAFANIMRPALPWITLETSILIVLPKEGAPPSTTIIVPSGK